MESIDSMTFIVRREVDIDIKPDGDPNSINPKSKGLAPVAILGSDEFDVADVDVTTLKFGPNEADPFHDLTDSAVYAEHLEDVNADSYMDLVLHFKIQELGLTDEIEATLTGSTLDEIPIGGTDSVNIVGK